MERRNVIFSCVFDWLCQNKGVKGQKDLSERTGISENTLTNILKGKTSVSDQTLHKLNAGFGYIFNMQYLRGQDTLYMLADSQEKSYVLPPDPAPASKEKEEAASLIELAAKLIKEVESLRHELTEELAEVRAMRRQMQVKEYPSDIQTSAILHVAQSKSCLKKKRK